jgi:hypothetical protein
MSTHRVVRIFALVAMSVLSAAPARSDEITNERIKLATKELAARESAGRGLGADEFYLFSLSPPISATELLVKSTADGLTVSAVHVCRAGGGVTAFFLDPNLSLGTELEEIRSKRYPDAKKLIANRPSAKPRPVTQRFDQFPDQLQFCGIEAVMPLSALGEFKSRLGNILQAVEISHARVRKLPINSL